MQTGGIPECATEQVIEVFGIRDEITLENRICMLEHRQMKVVESFMEDMKAPESAKDNHPMYRRYNEEYVVSR